MSDSQRIVDDPLDRLIRRSLSSRPESPLISNLAALAIERARALDELVVQQRRSLALYRWRLRILYAAATLFIIVLIFVGGNRLLSERRALTSADDSGSTTDSSTNTTETYVLWLGGLLFIGTLAGLATESAIAPDAPSLVC